MTEQQMHPLCSIVRKVGRSFMQEARGGHLWPRSSWTLLTGTAWLEQPWQIKHTSAMLQIIHTSGR